MADLVLGLPPPVVCLLGLGLTVGIGVADVMVGGCRCRRCISSRWPWRRLPPAGPGHGAVLTVANGGMILLVFVTIVFLVAATNEALADLKQANASLAATMKSLREFVAMAVHDLRDPQTALQTAAGLLGVPEADADPAPVQRIVANLVRNALRHGAPPSP